MTQYSITLILEDNSILKEYKSTLVPQISDLIYIDEDQTFETLLRLINYETESVIISGKLI